MTTWTDVQKQAIFLRNQNITVSASAGSGKTTILVERILTRVLHDHIPLDRILAMTFTEAAASEMKKRLFKALSNERDMTEHDPVALAYLEEQLVLLQRAHISTIHSFCLSVLQENYALIGFNLKRLQNIITDDYSVVLKQQAMQDAINVWIESPAFYQLKQYFSTKPQEMSVLKSHIELVAKGLGSLSDVKGFMHLVKSVYQSKNMALLPDTVRHQYFSFLLDYCYYIKETLDQMRLYYDGEKESCIDTKMKFLDQLIGDASQQNYSLFHLHFASYAAVITATCTSSSHYTSMRKQLDNLDSFLASILFEEDILFADLNDQYLMIDVLLQLAITYSDKYDELKITEEVMDFDDMENKALELLKVNDGEIAARYRHLFVDILVDEYQDSSYHQDELIRLIQNHDNVFRVGDVKQSIYRFRGAVPDLLKGYIYSPSELSEVIHLHHNYRSNSQIVTYVNQLFQIFMNLPGFQPLFSQHDVAEIGLPKQNTDQMSIHLHILLSDALKQNEDTEDEDQGESVDESETAFADIEEETGSDELRAVYISNLIIQDRSEKNKKWSDYAILVRSHNRKNSLKRAFEKANIPNFIDSREGFYNAAVIEVMRAFFKVLLDPDDNLHFAALCLSVIYGVSDIEMAEFKLQTASDSFYQTAKRSSLPVFKGIARDIERLQKVVTLRSLLQQIYQINYFYDNRTTSGDRTNLDLLYEKAVLFEEDGNRTLSELMEFTDALVDSKSSEALSINTAEDVVRVMTIHQSKGLQFDTVIYWGKEQPNKQSDPLFYLDPAIGIGMDYIKLPMRLQRPSMLKLMLEHQNIKEEISEEIRILYVALTRAKDQLIMVTSAKTKEIDSLREFPLTTYQLHRSMRFGHWIANLSAHMQSDLIKTTYVSNKFEPLTVLRKVSPSHTIPRWHGVEQIPAVLTPSDTKEIRLHGWESDSRQQSLGIATHQLIQRMSINELYDEANLRKLMKEIDESMMDEVDYQKVLLLQQNALYQQCRFLSVSKEMPFAYMNDSGQMVHGVMDFVAIDAANKKAVIIDFKTDQYTSKEKLLAAYEHQLLAYKEAMIHLYSDYQIDCFIYSLWLSQEIAVGS